MVISVGVGNGLRGERSGQCDFRPAAARYRRNRPGNAEGRTTLRCRGKIQSGDVGSVDRHCLAARVERVARTAGSNRIRPVCQSSESVVARAVGFRRGGLFFASLPPPPTPPPPPHFSLPPILT